MFLIYFFSALIGLCVGSFLNVVILRLPEGKKLKGRSYCPNCQKKLHWYELIPLFSYIFLLGKCSSCKKKISLQYPLVEITTALFFVIIVWQIGKTATNYLDTFSVLNIIFWFCFVSILIVIFMTDLKYYIVPDKVIYPAIFIAIFYQIANSIVQSKPLITNSMLSGLGGALFFLLLVLITRGKGMGVGDIKIGAFMGILLSFPNIIVALLLAFFSGSVIGLILVSTKKKTLKSEVPFGCFLAPATFIAFFWGSNLIHLYFSLLLR